MLPRPCCCCCCCREQFAPFLLPEDQEEDAEAYYERYCCELESTAAWGGHLELSALADALQRHITVHAVGMAPLSLGEAHGAASGPPLQLCYLRHAFGLGEHYNSTKALALGALDDEGADGSDGGGGESGAAAAAAADSDGEE